jgi:hypothetical protein
MIVGGHTAWGLGYQKSEQTATDAHQRVGSSREQPNFKPWIQAVKAESGEKGRVVGYAVFLAGPSVLFLSWLHLRLVVMLMSSVD